MVLIEKIEKYSKAKAVVEDLEYEKTAMSPTDFGKCPRAIYYNFKKNVPKEELDAQTLRVFSLGNSIHERWQGLFDEMGIQLRSEHRIETQVGSYKFHANVDSICVLDNKTYVVEIKSIKHFGFQRLNEAKPEHIGQTLLYMHFLGIKDGIIIYEDKDTSELKEFHIKYDKEKVESILNLFTQIYQNVLDDIEPKIPKTYSKAKYPCGWCQYKNHCYKEE